MDSKVPVLSGCFARVLHVGGESRRNLEAWLMLRVAHAPGVDGVGGIYHRLRQQGTDGHGHGHGHVTIITLP
eukprot:764973-Hanusia_phi.AAC.1